MVNSDVWSSELESITKIWQWVIDARSRDMAKLSATQSLNEVHFAPHKRPIAFRVKARPCYMFLHPNTLIEIHVCGPSILPIHKFIIWKSDAQNCLKLTSNIMSTYTIQINLEPFAICTFHQLQVLFYYLYNIRTVKLYDLSCTYFSLPKLQTCKLSARYLL